MMKEIKTIECRHIISEPGDGTRYDYLLAHDGPDEFTIAPVRSTFNFPQRINYWDAKAFLEDEGDAIVERANKINVNPWTLREVCRTITELWESGE